MDARDETRIGELEVRVDRRLGRVDSSLSARIDVLEARLEALNEKADRNAEDIAMLLDHVLRTVKH